MSTQLAKLLPEGIARHVRTGRDLMAARRRAPEDECLPTGCEPLDRLLRGGVHRGRMTELVSRGSSGRFSMVLSALAATTQRGDAAALIDLGDALSPAAADAAGIHLERLLWVRPTHVKEALMAMEAVIACGMPLVALDLGIPPLPGGRGVEAFWLRLTRSAQNRRCAVLVAAPYRVTGTAAHAVVEVQERRADWSGHGLQPRLLSALSNRLQLTRGPGWQRSSDETITFHMQSAVAEAPSPMEKATSAEPAQAPCDPLLRRRAIA